jgi:hypothetical protein
MHSYAKANGHKKKKVFWGIIYLSFALGFGLALGFGFAAETGFIGSPQHIISVVSQPHGSSTKITNPQSSQVYLSPFLFAKN